MSRRTTEICFTEDEQRHRLADALRRRLAPNTGLHPEQLAHMLGVTGRTVCNWRDGKTSGPDHYRLALLYHYFGTQFYVEVLGHIGEEIARRASERRRKQVRDEQQEAELLHMLSSPSIRGE